MAQKSFENEGLKKANTKKDVIGDLKTLAKGDWGSLRSLPGHGQKKGGSTRRKRQKPTQLRTS